MDHWETLTPLLVHIQANLDQELGLTALGRRASLSSAHLQRVFKATVGETPKGYVTRLRVERAAFCLLAHESTIAQVAANCGFERPETFIRAFRRRFGKSPREYRSSVRVEAAAWNEERRESLVGQRFALSKTRLIDIRPTHVAFRRHLGPYESVPESIFDELERWAARAHLSGPRIWMGIGHDAPIATPPHQLRFDAALVVPGPFKANRSIGYQLLPGGTHAVTTHAGPYETLGAGYAMIFPRLAAFRNYVAVGLPAVEVYHAAKINVRLALNHTDICLPMSRRGVSAVPS
ncbi:MAG: AraC family transcriptional regulator [Cytophagaceae bacterium]|nr:AraC family transcriptional regulator [Gemmatimonadaceae bacterium]